MAPNDLAPTWVRTGDVVRSDGPHEFGERVDLVELPFDWSLDDWPYFSYERPQQEGLRSPAEVFDIWAAELDYLVDVLGEGVFVLTMHPQCIGRGARMAMLGRLIDYMSSRPGVTFRTMAEVADEFRAASP